MKSPYCQPHLAKSSTIFSEVGPNNPVGYLYFVNFMVTLNQLLINSVYFLLYWTCSIILS